jgi:phage baseplate assembly protein W
MSQSPISALKFLGRGWNFPVVPDPGGALDYAEGVEKVRQSILLILDTDPGERIMRPTFGAGLRRYLMKPNTPANRALLGQDVSDALATWEPRIRVDSVLVTPGDDPSEVIIQITYVHIFNGQPGNLVYPFFLD